MGFVKNFVDRYVVKHAQAVKTETKDVHVIVENVNTEFALAKVTNKHTGSLRNVALGTFVRVQIENNNTLDAKVVSVGRSGFEATFYDNNQQRHIDWFPYGDLLFTYDW